MITYRPVVVLFVLLFVIAGIGCSSGGKSPVTLMPTGMTPSTIDTTIPVGVSEFDSSGNPVAGSGALGLFSVHIDPKNQTGEIISLRSAALEDVLEVVDITNFLQLAPCSDCVKLDSVELNADGNVVVSIGIKHPFEPGNPLLPITGKNRGDLHVFNVEGTVISSNTAIAFAGIGKSIADFNLLNADGYSGYLNSVIGQFYPTPADIHPYILHFDDYSSGNFDPNSPTGFTSVTVPLPSGNLVMPMGSDYDFKDYIFEFTNEPLDFILAVGCTYAVSSASKIERFSPEYRIPQHNKKAASEVWVEITGDSLESGDSTSSVIAQIFVVDINHGVPVGTNLDEMRADSSVASIQIDIPGITTSVLNIDPNPISGSGHDPSDPLVFEVEIFNDAEAEEGIYTGLVKVTDSYPPGLNESELLGGMDGIERVDPVVNPLEGLFAIPSFETYQIFSVEVEETITAIYVKNTHPGPIFDGTRQNPYATIQEGIDAVPDEWVVLVDDTDVPYNENVFMKDGATVIAENWDEADGTGRVLIDPPDTPNMGTVNFIDVSNATISGFDIGYSGAFDPGHIMNMIHIVGGSDNVVRDCYFGGITEGIMVNCVNAIDSTNLTVEYCTMENIDSVTESLYAARAIYAENCPDLVFKNNRMTDWFETPNPRGIWTHIVSIHSSDNVVIKNNLISHMTPLSNRDGAQSIWGIFLAECDDATVINNTVDDINVNDSFFIQQTFAYWFEDCLDLDFRNNIASRLRADYSWPSGLARGVQHMLYDATLICDYMCIFDVATPYFQNPPHGYAEAGVGSILLDPQYIDPDNNNYDLQETSPAQMGDPSFLDWDDDDSGGIQSRSRMGCHGGPGGEFVGNIT